MLWNVVYEFFIKYIFGGLYGGVSFEGALGDFMDGSTPSSVNTSYINVYRITTISGYTFYLTLGNYLSLIATIISMVAIVLICCSLIKKIYNMCAHIIG